MKHAWILATCFVALNVNAAAKPEDNPTAPRVPPDKIAAAKAMKSPIPVSDENIAEGKKMFTGSATCWTCHGKEGKQRIGWRRPFLRCVASHKGIPSRPSGSPSI